MTPDPPFVSAVIPVYNQERFLAQAVESVLSQSYRPIELVVVDDGSDDGSAQVAKSYESVRLFQQENQGVAAARNLGILKAEGEYIAFLDADDCWDKDKIKLQMEHILRHQQVRCLVCRFRGFFEPGIKSPPWLNREDFLSERAGCMPAPSSLVVEKEVFSLVGPFNPEYRTGEDIDWFVRAKDKGVTIHTLPQILVTRRLHDRNLSYRSKQDSSNLLHILKGSIERKRKDEKKKES